MFKTFNFWPNYQNNWFRVIIMWYKIEKSMQKSLELIFWYVACHEAKSGRRKTFLKVVKSESDEKLLCCRYIWDLADKLRNIKRKIKDKLQIFYQNNSWFAIYFTVREKIRVEKDWEIALNFALGMLSIRGPSDILMDLLNQQLIVCI